MRIRIAPVMLAIALMPAGAWAQGNWPLRPFVFAVDEQVSLRADGSYLFQHTDGNLVFEAQVAPDLRLADNFSGALRRVLDADRPRVAAHSLYLTPMFRLRMFDEDSSPVRTPSYMPKISFQVAWLKNLSRATEAEARHDGPIEMWLLHTIPFGHHSNGENGCLFLDQQKVDGACVPQGAAGARAVNKDNGSFSTNYVRAGLFYGRMYLRGDDPDVEDRVWLPAREWTVGASLEVNPQGYVSGSIAPQLKQVYGATRLRLTADVALRRWTPAAWLECGRASVTGALEYVHDAPATVSDVILSVEASCLPKTWGGMGLFVRYYRGQDYYNVAFDEQIHRLQFGLTFGLAKFLLFPIPALN
jgi:hypothetical protein